MALTDVNLQNVVFQEVATVDGENFIINPFDLNGNVIESINVTVNTSEQDGAVTLPLISSLNPSTNVTVTVIQRKNDSDNFLSVLPAVDSDDTISGGSQVILPNNDGSNLVFRVAGTNSWSVSGQTIPA
jgi:hypothetical protein